MDNSVIGQALISMMNTIDTIKEQIGDGNYLQLCNNLKRISDIKCRELESVPLHDELYRVLDEALDDVELDRLYDCRVYFTETRVFSIHDDDCGVSCRRHKRIIMAYSHIVNNVYLTGRELEDVLLDLRDEGQHRVLMPNFRVSCTLYRRLHLHLRLLQEPKDLPKAKIGDKCFIVTKIEYILVGNDNDD